MRTLDRRDFIKRTAGAVAASLSLPALGRAAEVATQPGVSATMTRTLGDTGLTSTLLGIGTGMHGWNGESDLTRKGRAACLDMLSYAYERGLRYFDLADMYGSHDYMRELMTGPINRDEILILTKTATREGDLIRADLERFRKELDTDYLDVVLLHCLTDNDGPDWPEKHKSATDALAEAKARGVIRAHGCSCHSLSALKTAAETEWVDVVLARINPFGVRMDGPPEEVAPILETAHAAGKGVLGMKIVGEGALTDKIDESLRFVLGLGSVDALAIGFLEPSELDQVVGMLDNLKLA